MPRSATFPGPTCPAPKPAVTDYSTSYFKMRTRLIQLLFPQVKTTGWEVTLERQKLRAEALANEFGALVEYAARKILGMLRHIV